MSLEEKTKVRFTPFLAFCFPLSIHLGLFMDLFRISTFLRQELRPGFTSTSSVRSWSITRRREDFSAVLYRGREPLFAKLLSLSRYPLRWTHRKATRFASWGSAAPARTPSSRWLRRPALSEPPTPCTWQCLPRGSWSRAIRRMPWKRERA